MIIIQKNSDDFFKDYKRDTLINTVNCVGAMGKGIALEFKKRFPEMFKKYKELCDKNEIQIGKMNCFHTPTNLIINFPTKKHWKDSSNYEWIELGLIDLRNIIELKKLKIIRMPALGCSNGQLDFKEVMRLIHKHLDDLNEVSILVFPPH